MRRTILVSLCVLAVFSGVIVLSNLYDDPVGGPSAERRGRTTPVAAYVLESFQQDTGAANAVAAIYLNYRVYDTLFEALLLLIAIVAIIHFFRIGTR